MKIKFSPFLLVIVVLSLCYTPAFSQVARDSSLPGTEDTIRPASPKKVVDTNDKKRIADTVKALKSRKVVLQPDTLKSAGTGSTKKTVIPAPNPYADSVAKPRSPVAVSDTAMNTPYKSAMPADFLINQMLLKNRFINVKDPPVFLRQQPHHANGREFLFYTLCLIVLILGIFKSFYKNFFRNLFRVYFNTSLRQTQLADQLSQAKLPSFILNLFFAVTAGIYLWLLFNLYHPSKLIHNKFLLAFCILVIALLYFVKFCLLKFTGWVSDIRPTTNNYIFVIFLVNKITGILLVPIIILLAFLKTEWVPVVANISFLILGLLFLSRYIKSYGTLENKLPMNPFHFVVFILAAEVIPLLLIYKVAIDYLI